MSTMQLVSPKMATFPHPEADAAQWESFCSMNPATWRTLVAQASTYMTSMYRESKPCEDVAPNPFACEMCPKVFRSSRALASHNRHSHQPLATSRYYADGSICRSCQMEFQTRPRLLLHFASVPRCLAAAQMSREPLTEEQVHDFDSRDRVLRLQIRKRGLPVSSQSTLPRPLSQESEPRERLNRPSGRGQGQL